ncbi:hypothetical protein, partial [Streptomyces sp. NPDC041003]|uniref:hypothetical protein n=1 Tax=Streptomyces sp. NPDC041003 TaxID=3155730 RepID=UPI00340D9085
SFFSGGHLAGPPFLMNEKLRCIHRSSNRLVAHETHHCSPEPAIHCNGFNFNATLNAQLIAMS